MEKVSFEIEREDVAEALHAEAEAHGRSVEEELAALVEKTYAPAGGAKGRGPNDDWVRELAQLAKDLDLGDGFEGLIPERTSETYRPVEL